MTDEAPGAQLVPHPPTAGPPIVFGVREQFLIGSADNAQLSVTEAGVLPRHCLLAFTQHGWLLVPGDGTVSVNGEVATGARRLFDRDIIAISATLQWEFVSGETRTRLMPRVRASAFALPVRSKRRAFATAGRRYPWRAMALVTTLILFALVATRVVQQDRRDAAMVSAVLSTPQAAEFDSLLSDAYDHIERGNSLLELGLASEAAAEFARGVNTLAVSALRDHPLVKPRIAALEYVVASIYRDRKLSVPAAFASSSSSLTSETMRVPTLSVDQFAHTFDLVAGGFRLRFRKPIVVVGRDHAEHLSLYGPGGALDLRSSTMSAEQVAYVVAQCHSYGIRVKDFSQDSILQRQVRAAISAGRADRAGTGLHLHIDRFADRHDQWTIRPPA
ncbi:MAG: FHA domain-containing protein [Gemmatimonas sp.]